MASSQAEVEYCVLNVQHGVRLDGRATTDFRSMELKLGPIEQASGSARLRIGDTDVIVAVKVGRCDEAQPRSRAVHAWRLPRCRTTGAHDGSHAMQVLLACTCLCVARLRWAA